MNNQLAVIITAIAISSIATIGWASTGAAQDNSLSSSAALLGHITLTAYDEDGKIIQYAQTDNVIIDAGDDCIVEDLFGANGGCFGTVDVADNFDHIALGTGTNTMTEGSGLAQLTWHSQTGGAAGALTAATGGAGASTTITANFFDVSDTITEAALSNSATTATADTIAVQDFGDIILGSTDDLTVQWTITVDGT